MLLLQANTTELFSVRDLHLIAPEIILTISACVALVMEVVLPYRKSKWTAYFSLAGLALAAASLLVAWQGAGRGGFPLDGFYGMIRLDGFAVVFKLIFLVSAALTIAISLRFLDAEGEQRGEFYALVLFATTGMMFLASGYDLIILYISLELMALTFYVLVAYTKRERRTNEAGMKYFLLGAFSSGVLLYGMSMIFGLAESTNLGDISRRAGEIMAASTSVVETSDIALKPLLLLGMVALAAGLFFKIAAVPFHMWAPDAYEGAPTPVTAFLSTGSKAASFALFARIFLEALGPMRVDWAPLLGVVAAVTIAVGNWAAVTQTNSKRLLAYSSISNAGYLLLGIIAANNYGYTGLVIYLFVYTLMNMGAFGVIIALHRRGVGDQLDDLRGLGQKAPAVAVMMAIFMLSLGGIPGTGGFIGKYFLFGGLLQRGAIEQSNWYTWLAVWAILNTVVSFYYYFLFIRRMYLDEGAADARPLSLSPALQVALAVSVAGIIAIGVYPQPFINIAQAVFNTIASVGGAVAAR